MKIKKRLFISNILMIVIPIIIAITILIAGITIIWMTMFNGSGYEIKDQKQFYMIRKGLMELTVEFLKDDDQIEQKQKMSEIENTLNLNDMSLNVFNDDRLQYSIGKSNNLHNDKLVNAIQALGGEGTISLENEEIVVEKFQVQDKIYSIYIFSTKLYSNNKRISATMVNVVGLVLLGILMIIFLTNRFLTKFVFQKIREPLDILANGVNQIRDGNLDYRILYSGKDEFSVVCDDFNDMAVRLKKSVTQTQKQEQSRKELLADISHDLRSPLTSIKAYTEGLMDNVAKTPAMQKNYMQMIKTKAEDIDHMVAKLFLFSKMDLGDYPYYPETLNLEKEIMSMVYAISEEHGSKGLDVKVEGFSEDINIYVDPVQLRSVFTNILENSLKYNDKEQPCAIIRSESNDNVLQISIEDNGPGVPEEALPKLFDVFYRCDPSRNNPNSGSGLGLAITAKAIERMGGSIWAKNSTSNGFSMVINLPIKSKE